MLKIVTDFAILECRAIELRKERFALADSIRSTEDNLLLAKGDSVAVRQLRSHLERYDNLKDELVKSSLELAEHIEMQLDSFMKHEFKTAPQRKHFDDALKTELRRRACI